VHSVSQWLNLKHLAESLRGAVGLLKAVSYKGATESVCRSRTANGKRQCVPDCGGCNAKTTVGKNCADNWNWAQIGVGSMYRTCKKLLRVW